MNLYHEKDGDVFELADEGYHLVQCVSNDLKMGSGISIDFDKKFRVRSYINRHYTDSDFGVQKALYTGDSFVLITKDRYFEKPNYIDLDRSLKNLRELCIKLKITKLAMPRLGCGLDLLEWVYVKDIIKDIFYETDIEVQVRRG